MILLEIWSDDRRADNVAEDLRRTLDNVGCLPARSIVEPEVEVETSRERPDRAFARAAMRY